VQIEFQGPIYFLLSEVQGPTFICNHYFQEQFIINEVGSFSKSSGPKPHFLLLSFDIYNKIYCFCSFSQVENASGLSNFVPVLFGSKQICTELTEIQKIALSTNSYFNSLSCEYFVSKQNVISQLLLDIAWLQKKPDLNEYKNELNTANIQRLTCLLRFLVSNHLVNLLEIVLCSVEKSFSSEVLSNLNKYKFDADVAQLLDLLDHAKECLHHPAMHGVKSDVGLSNYPYCIDDFRLSLACTDQVNIILIHNSI
jgi:hypothetical protein